MVQRSGSTLLGLLLKPFTVVEIRDLVAQSCRQNNQRRRLDAHHKQVEKIATRSEIILMERNVYAGILHDLGSPLTFLSGISELLRDELALSINTTPERLNEWRNRAQQLFQQASYCGELSRRSVRYLQNDNSINCEVKQIFTDLEQILRANPFNRDQLLTVRPIGKELRATISGVDLLRALINLGLNALQSSAQPNRVEVDAWLLHEPVHVDSLLTHSLSVVTGRETFKNTAPLVAISIRDTGSGIAPELLSRLFHEIITTKEHSSGTGLGLTIVRESIINAGGLIHLRSQVGQGSTFTLFLPAEPIS
ncbi:MAG: HAMP domain-containing histidine kinase [Pedosphaera sp.]|nr:HAMP domain-containing histidine kinase [Pedosphaera sp.]